MFNNKKFILKNIHCQFMQMYPMPGQNMYGYQNMNQYRYDIPQISGNTNPYADYGLQGYQQPLSNLNQINQNYYFPAKGYQGQKQTQMHYQAPASFQVPQFNPDVKVIQHNENKYTLPNQEFQNQYPVNPIYQQNVIQKPSQTKEIIKQHAHPTKIEKQVVPTKLKPDEKQPDNSKEYFYRQLLIPKTSLEVSKMFYPKEIIAKEKIVKKEFFIGFSHDNVWDYYQALKLIGKGSFGEVYEASCKKTNQRRAVKKISKSIIKTKPKLREQMKKEFDILRKLDHPNIMKIYEAFESKNTIYIVTEYLSGGTLLEYFEKHNFS